MRTTLLTVIGFATTAILANTPPAITNVRASQREGTKLVDIYYDAADADNDGRVDETDAEAHERLICLGTNRKITDPNVMLYSKQEWFKTQAEMNAVFADVPEALQNTSEELDKV